MLGGATIARPLTASATAARTAARSAPAFVVIRIESSWPCRPVTFCANASGARTYCPPLRSVSCLPRSTSVTVTSPEPSWNLSPLPWPTAGPTWTPSGVCDNCFTGRATASFRAPPNSALLASAPNNRTGPDGVCADIRIIGAAAATPGTAATSAVIASGNPASVMPDTSSAATPATPSANRFTDPVIDPKMPNTATRYIADTAITAIEAIVRLRWTVSSRRLNRRSRLAAAVIVEPGLTPAPPTSRRSRAVRPAA